MKWFTFDGIHSDVPYAVKETQSESMKSYSIRYEERSVKFVTIKAENSAKALAEFYRMAANNEIDFADMEVINTKTEIMEE